MTVPPAQYHSYGGMTVDPPNAVMKRVWATSPWAELYVDPVHLSIGGRGRLARRQNLFVDMPCPYVVRCFRVRTWSVRGVAVRHASGTVHCFTTRKWLVVLDALRRCGYPVVPEPGRGRGDLFGTVVPRMWGFPAGSTPAAVPDPPRCPHRRVHPTGAPGPAAK